MKTKSRKRTMQRAAETFTLHQLYLNMTSHPIMRVSMEQNVLAVEAYVDLHDDVRMEYIKERIAREFAKQIVNSDFMKIEVVDRFGSENHFGPHKVLRGSIRVLVPKSY